jgi:hypothetical protein
VDCSFAKDFAGPLATVVAAGAAVWVTAHFSSQQAETARRQAKTAKDQLRLNLFDKRYAVYKDIERHLGILLMPPDEPEAKLSAGLLFVAFGEAEFFFSPATCEWLKTVKDDCQAFVEAADARREGRGDSRQYLDREHELDRHFREMPKRFHDDLSFSQPTPD